MMSDQIIINDQKSSNNSDRSLTDLVINPHLNRHQTRGKQHNKWSTKRVNTNRRRLQRIY